MKQTVFKISAVLALAIFSILLSPLISRAKQTINVGIMGNFTVADIDTAEPYDNYMLNGVLMAVDEYNSQKGAPYYINIIKYDHSDKPSLAITAAEQAAGSNIVAAIGYLRSLNALLSAPIMHKADLPLIVVLASHDDILKQGDSIFKVCYTDSNQINSLLNHLREETNIRKLVGVAAKDNPHVVNFFKEFKKISDAYGIKLIREYDILDYDDKFSFLNELSNLDFDGILTTNGTYVTSALIKQLHNFNIKKPVIGTDSWGTDARIYDLTDGVVFDAIQSIHWSKKMDSEANRKFVNSYRVNYKKYPLSSSACAYDAGKLLIEALKTCDTCATRQSIKENLKKIKSHRGLTGSWHYDKDGKFIKKALIIKLDGHDFEVLGEY